MSYNQGLVVQKETLIANEHYRLDFNLGKINEIFQHSWKEHLKITKIAKFGYEIF